MTYFASELSILVDGERVPLARAQADPLSRAVIISLFTWRRAEPDDVLPADRRHGWWGDSYATAQGDRIGSRLWLLSRAKLTLETIARARHYGEEALAWLVADGVASRIEVAAERLGLDGLALSCRIWRHDGRPVDLRFSDVWKVLNV